jgi:hypothetical protein
MNHDVLKIAAALCLAGTASAAMAQSARNGGEPSRPEHVQMLARFSRCVAHQWPDRARWVLGLDIGTDRYQRELRDLAFGSASCLHNGGLYFSPVLFAGGLAEQLLRERAALNALPAHVGLDSSRPPVAARDETEVMSLCAVRAAPGEVAALLRTEAASREEGEALAAIAPHFAQCLGTGNQVRLNRIAARSLLALAAYRLGEHNGWTRTASAAPPAER